MLDSTVWATRPHPGRKITPLALTREQRTRLEVLLNTPTTELRVARRAQGILLLADGVCVADVAMLVGVHSSTVNDWKLRFSGKDLMERLTDAHRSGRPISLFQPPTPRVSSQKRADRQPK